MSPCLSPSAHILAVGDATFLGIETCNRDCLMADLAVAIQPIRRAFIGVEFAHWLCRVASSTALLRRPCFVAVVIVLILCVGIPSEIRKSVVALSMIWIMASLLSDGSWTDERLQNQAVNCARERLAIQVEVDLVISHFVDVIGQFTRGASTPRSAVIPSFGLNCPDMTVSGREIAREPWNRSHVHQLPMPITGTPVLNWPLLSNMSSMLRTNYSHVN